MANDDDNTEKTKILCDYDNIMGKFLESILQSGKIFDICCDAKTVSYMVSNEPIMSAGCDFVRGGGKMRIVRDHKLQHCCLQGNDQDCRPKTPRRKNEYFFSN
jgi:hypothetical protein